MPSERPLTTRPAQPSDPTPEIASAERGQLYLYARELLFAVPGLTTDVCQLGGGTLALALAGTFRLEIPDRGASPELQMALLAPHTRARFLGPNTPTLFYVYDVDTEAFGGLASEARYPVPPDCRALAPELRAALPYTDALLQGMAHPEHVDAVRRALLAATAGRRKAPVGLDPRIQATVARMREACPESVSVASLARAEGLSSGRLMHLFKAQTGVPMRRFGLWLKTRRALWLAARSSSITDVAPMAGFADSSHLSRTIHDMFGLWPSYFASRRRVIMHIDDRRAQGGA